jgi:hypothetical protein
MFVKSYATSLAIATGSVQCRNTFRLASHRHASRCVATLRSRTVAYGVRAAILEVSEALATLSVQRAAAGRAMCRGAMCCTPPSQLHTQVASQHFRGNQCPLPAAPVRVHLRHV